MSYNPNYTCKGIGTLDGEPVYFHSEKSVTFLRNGERYSLKAGFFREHVEEIGDVRLRSGWTCDPKSGEGRYLQTNPTRSFSALPNLKSLTGARNDDITNGSLFSLFKGEYPSLVDQYANMSAARDAQWTNGCKFPISRSIALASTPAIMRTSDNMVDDKGYRILHRPHTDAVDSHVHPLCMRMRESDGAYIFFIREDYAAASLFHHELEKATSDIGDDILVLIHTVPVDDFNSGIDPTREYSDEDLASLREDAGVDGGGAPDAGGF